jgi:enolase-phosphatase E1
VIEAVITDIEGTTSSLSFVKDVLFPYSRDRMAEYVRRHAGDPEVSALLDDVRREAGDAGLDLAGVTARLVAWIDADEKVTALKALQGMIWESGFRQGDFQAHVYPDAERVLRAWRERGCRLYVYSSGSVYAQKLFFAHTEFGDLTSLFDGHFDTTTGPKKEAESYRRIARAIATPPQHTVFLSDIEAELDAAREAGLHTVWLVRDVVPDPEAAHRQVNDFDAVAHLCERREAI